MSIFTIVNERQTAERQELLADYYGYLSAMNVEHPSEAEASTLSEHLRSLNRTAAQAEADLERVMEAKRHVDALAQTADVGETLSRLDAELSTAYAERQAVHQAMNVKVTTALVARDAAAYERQRRDAATNYLNALKSSDPLLYSAMVRPPQADAELAVESQPKRKQK